MGARVAIVSDAAVTGLPSDHRQGLSLSVKVRWSRPTEIDATKPRCRLIFRSRPIHSSVGYRILIASLSGSVDGLTTGTKALTGSGLAIPTWVVVTTVSGTPARASEDTPSSARIGKRINDGIGMGFLQMTGRDLPDVHGPSAPKRSTKTARRTKNRASSMRPSWPRH